MSAESLRARLSQGLNPAYRRDNSHVVALKMSSMFHLVFHPDQFSPDEMTSFRKDLGYDEKTDQLEEDWLALREDLRADLGGDWNLSFDPDFNNRVQKALPSTGW